MFIIDYVVFMYSIGYSCQILIKLGISRQTFEKSSHHISWKSVQWESSCSMRTDTQAWHSQSLV